MIKRRKNGQLIVISGPSGVGKSTVIAEVMHRRDRLYFSVSYTTRDPRAGEQDGVNYHFVDEAEFERMIQADELLEYTRYQGHYYGTSQKVIQEKLADAIEELERRLYGRRTESDEVIQGRLQRAHEEMKEIPNYDYLVVNDSVENAANEILAILAAERCRVDKIGI